MLERFGEIRTADEFNGDKIYRLENILTLEPTLRDWFEQLNIWLERKSDVGTFNKCFGGND